MAKSNVIIIDQRQENQERDKSKTLYKLAMDIRNEYPLLLKRCILAIRDLDSLAFLNLSSSIGRDKALVEVLFDKGETTETKRKVKLFQVEDSIIKKGYKVVASNIFVDPINDENSHCKLVVSF